MHRIGVTGYTGFVGKNLCAYFREKLYKLNLISLRNKAESFFDGDESVIIHLAGKAHDLSKSNNFDAYRQINTDLTKKVFDEFLKSNANVFVFLSSIKAVADSANTAIDESFTPNPKSEYGISKLLAEKYILSKGNLKNKKVYILRPCMIHGPNNKGNLNLLYNLIYHKIPYPLAAFNNKRSFLGIRNLNFIINELIVNPNIPSGIYNIADSTGVSTTNIVETINECLGYKNKNLKLNKRVVNSFAKIGSILNLPFNSERLTKLTENYMVSNNKILAAIGSPLPYSTLENLKFTFNSFKDEK